MLPSRSQVIHVQKSRGSRVAAVFPIHYPRALLRAFDILPVEVWGPPKIDPGPGTAHVQPYICSIVRNALSFVLSGGLAETDLLVVPHACDSLQGFGSVLLDFVHPAQPVLPIYLPRGNRECDRMFLADEFRVLYQKLVELTQCHPSDMQLMECIRREERADELLGQLHRRRRNLSLTQIDFYRLVRSREFLPAEDFIEIAKAALAQGTSTPANEGVPIVLSGIVPEPMDLFAALAEMNASVVADDLACCGRRVYPAGTSGDPFVRMAQSILAAPPDSTRGSPIQDRLEYLVHLAQESGAKGVVFYGIKFCEPELFYLPALRKGLQEAGLRSVAVEVDLNEPLSQQVSTRLEAFLEMLSIAGAIRVGG